MFLELDGTIIDANKAYEKLTGFSRQKIIGKHASEFVHPDHKEDLVEFYRQIEKYGSVSFESKNIYKNGRSVWVDIPAVTIARHAKKIVLSSIRDISDRKLAEAELSEQYVWYSICL